MLIANENITNMIDSTTREIKARVEHYNGSTLVQIFKSSDALVSAKVDRTGTQGKFFGFGVAHKLTVELIDKDRQINITEGDILECAYGVEADYIYTYPAFKVSEVTRDENTNALTVVANCALSDAAGLTVNDLNLPTSYTIKDFARACAKLLKLPLKIENVTDDCFDTIFETGANFEGTESIRDALNAVAEATQTIFYISSEWELTFKRLDVDGDAVLTIDKSKYFTLQSKESKTLATVCSATELGDNVSASKQKTIKSKNLVLFPYTNKSVTHNGVTFTVNEDGTITANGTASAAGAYIIIATFQNNPLPVGTVTLSGAPQGTYIAVAVGSSFSCSNGNSTTFSITEDMRQNNMACRVYPNTTVDNVVFKPMIETGTQATEYECYFAPYDVPIEGDIQYVRDNPFWDMREDVDILVSKAADTIGGITINPYDCQWRGNFLVELGDKIELITKDNNSVMSYVLNDTFTYNGGLSAQTSWSAEESKAETASNPASLGDALKQTFAKVDKASKQIELLVSESGENSANLSRLQMETDKINATVQANKSATDGEIELLKAQAQLSVTAEDVTIEIERQLENGIDKVETKVNKFTFDDAGLTIAKSDSELETNINEDGLSVFKGGNEVLTADNKGVKAIDLHAKTYLIIGQNSRIEDFESNRTGLFWIGE